MTRSTRQFTVTVADTSAGVFDWTRPAIGTVQDVSASTLAGVASTFTITRPPGVTGNGVSTRGIYRDSGIAYSPLLGTSGAVLVSAGGHNDSANNGTYWFDCKTGLWTEWKAPSNVFRNASAYDVERITGSLLIASRSEAGSEDDVNAGSGVPGATHSWSHSLVIPSGVIPGTTSPVFWRAQVGCGWTNSSMAQQPFWYTHLSNAANPWVHIDGVSADPLTYLNGSAYYSGKVYFFGNSQSYAKVVDLATGTLDADWSYPLFRNGSGWVTQISDGGQDYFMFVSGSFSDDLVQNGGSGSPRVRLLNIQTKALTTISLTGVSLPKATRSTGGVLTDDFYYSPCWSADKRAIYLTRWVSDDGFIGTDSGVNATNKTATKVYKLAAPTNILEPWTVTEQTVSPYYTPDTGSQMRPRSFYVNGCVLNFPSTGAPVQAIGVS